MVSILDVATFALQQFDQLSTMKLQKLAFYSQAAHLVRFKKPLFPEDFQAWVNGPVCPDLFNEHRGFFWIEPGQLGGNGNPENLTDDQKDVIREVCDRLRDIPGGELSKITHQEAPWRDARGNLPPDACCATTISKDSMRRFYGDIWGTPIASSG